MLPKVKIGLCGAGHLGKIHIQCLKQLDAIELIGFYDVNEEIRETISQQFDVRAFDSLEELLDCIDAVDIVSTTTSHFEIAKAAIQRKLHCFIEKPVCSTVEEAEELAELNTHSKVQIQIGHVERFNATFSAVRPFIRNPKFIEAHRLSSFNPRGRDVSVIHDIMIHDLDLISLLANSEVKEIRASGVSIVSKHPDICNARIEFENGLVANVTASRISMKQMRKLRIFQEDAYLSLDLLEKEVQIVRLLDEPGDQTIEIDTHKGKKYISLIQPEILSVNAILEELKSFINSIVRSEVPEVSLTDGIRALKLVQAISKQIENQND